MFIKINIFQIYKYLNSGDIFLADLTCNSIYTTFSGAQIKVRSVTAKRSEQKDM